MDWIETLFGWSPDGGNGTTELLVVLACCVALAGVIVWRVPALHERVRRLFGAARRGPT